VKNLKIFIITGLSGSGKSTAIAAFEDVGFYCVDNMPVALLPKFLQLPVVNTSEVAGLAFVMDLREKDFLAEYQTVFESLHETGYRFEILFLEADEDVLIQRFSQTRRPHPLAGNKNLTESIRAEVEKLKGLREAAGRIINTSRYNVHELKSAILDIAQKSRKESHMRVHVQSFGFKYGLPREADLVIDVRFLPNPHFVTDLKNMDGEAEEVRQYVMKFTETRSFLEKYFSLLDFLIPRYEKEGKTYLTIAVGCTGGRHRSVVVARAIYDHLDKKRRSIEITHRDIEQW
jgi:UPF0042 nucleotide-binding protein